MAKLTINTIPPAKPELEYVLKLTETEARALRDGSIGVMPSHVRTALQPLYDHLDNTGGYVGAVVFRDFDLLY